jgi:DNA replication ATP-dependent helicase Dna2
LSAADHSRLESSSVPDRAEDMGAFLRKLRHLVLDETESVRQQIFGVWSKPVAARVAESQAIEGVRIVDVAPSGVIELACDRNMSRFREGDVLLLNRGDPFAAPSMLVTLEVDDETRLLVSSEDPDVNWATVLHERAGWVLDQGFLDFSQFVLDALDQAGDTAIGRERVLPLLMGTSRPTLDLARYNRAYDRAEVWGLNDTQCEALAQAYATNLAYLIQGPPGTGKTLVLARLAQLLAEDGERVLITAFTHRAINNALNKLAELDQRMDATPLSFCKIGRHARADDLDGVENYEAFELSPLTELSGAYVIGATPFATRTRRLSGVEFDTVVFDEASQITLPLAVMGMLVARRFVFIGDGRQLPPVLTTRQSGGAFRDSVFGALSGRRFDTMLEETYRMNAELTAWPSRQFYTGALRPAPAVAGRRIAYPRPPARFGAILDPAEPAVFVDLKHRNATTRSAAEAGMVVDLIATLLEAGVPAEQIGVVAPYRAQGREIRNLLRAIVPDAAVRRQIVVDTVERMQGQERDLVILSLTTSSPAFASRVAEFFFQPERLNVAITRPRTKLIVVGSSHLLAAAPERAEYQQLVEQLRDLLQSCAYHVLPYGR